MQTTPRIKGIIQFVALANLLFFFVEFYYARKIESVSLFGDSIDFLEDASINYLILIGLSWSATARAKLGRFLAFIILIPGLSSIWVVVLKIQNLSIPVPATLSVVGAGALLVNSICAFRIAKIQKNAGSLVKAAYLSARNDVLANVAIIIAGFLTYGTQSFWPDLIVGIGIILMNADAAKEVWEAAKKDHALAS